MARPSDAAPRPPQDFAPFLATDEPVFLVGGQAVNLWALYYEAHTAELAPFVSRDVDVLGDAETLTALAKLARTKPQFFPSKPPTNEIGVVVTKDIHGHPLLIEVLRYVHGVTNEDLRELTYTMALGNTYVRVPGPIALLQAKIANVSDLDQLGRQDSHHVKILYRLIPAYLDELQLAAKKGRLNERKLIEILERLLDVITSKSAKKIFESLQLNPKRIFENLVSDNLPKVQAFMTKRLPRLL